MHDLDKPGPGVQGYQFTERTRKVLGLARDEARELGHEYVGTEHILLGLIREGEGIAVAVLGNLNVDVEDVEGRVKDVVKQGKGTVDAEDLPYTSRAKKVLELSMTEARELSHSWVGTEHLLLGLIREEKGIAAQILTEFGVELDRARVECLRLLGSDVPPLPTQPTQDARWAARYVQAKVQELNRAIDKAREHDLRVEYTVDEKTKHLGVNLFAPVRP